MTGNGATPDHIEAPVVAQTGISLFFWRLPAYGLLLETHHPDVGIAPNPLFMRLHAKLKIHAFAICYHRLHVAGAG